MPARKWRSATTPSAAPAFHASGATPSNVAARVAAKKMRMDRLHRDRVLAGARPSGRRVRDRLVREGEHRGDEEGKPGAHGG
jgi:hypothetical protein